jgi:hypothetical protein
MTEEDLQAWLDNNPEAREIYNRYIASHAKPTATDGPSPTAPPVVELVPSSVACFKVIYPPDKSSLSFNGLVNFQWENQPGADHYIVTFYYPDGTNVPFQTSGTELMRSIDTMLDGGNYYWDVIAIGENSTEICRASGQSFTKPSSHTEDLVNPPQKDKCEVGQYENPGAPCYCDPYSENPPPYCGGGNGNWGE